MKDDSSLSPSGRGTTRTAVVVGYGATALGIVRCLAGSGFRIVTIGYYSNARKSVLYHSRIPDRKIIVEQGRDLTQVLIDLGAEFEGPPVLLLSEDRQAWSVSERREEILSRYRIQLPPETLVASLLDKERFHELAVEMDLRVPRSLTTTSRDDVRAATSELSFPLVIKPSLRHARKVGDWNELDAFLDTLTDENWGSMVTQQWIPGDDRSLHCCFAYFDKHSSPLGCVTAQKIRQWIPRSGTTSLCRTVRNDDVRAETVRIFGELGLVGYGSIEYKLHPNEGVYYVMEPTVIRYNKQVGLFERAQANLPLIAAEYLERGQVRPCMQRDDVWWIHEIHDFLSRRDRRQTVKTSYWRSLLSADTRVLFSGKDPLPLFAAIGSTISSRLRKGRTKLSDD